MSTEQDVRDAAVMLHAAIAAAEKDGYRVTWPANAAALPLIAISETGAVRTADPVAPPPTELSADEPD
jgi:hypothetical protein